MILIRGSKRACVLDFLFLEGSKLNSLGEKAFWVKRLFERVKVTSVYCPGILS